MIRNLVVTAVVVGASLAAGIIGSSGTASAHPHRPAVGVCVSYGTLPLIDADVRYAASVYTPADGACATGDTFVPVARGPR